MAKRKKRRSTRQQKQKQSDYPGWVWMLFGLAIGLSVAFAIYVKDRNPVVVARTLPTEPASMQNSLDSNGENLPAEPVAQKQPKPRFEFYEMLPAYEVEITDESPAIDKDQEPQAIEEPGLYLLQAGSFSTNGDADRRRAELALHGIESYVQRVDVNGRNYHRVYVGPTEDLKKLNLLRSRLRAAKIDVLRIRLGD